MLQIIMSYILVFVPAPKLFPLARYTLARAAVELMIFIAINYLRDVTIRAFQR